jgi:hypothetical protein
MADRVGNGSNVGAQRAEIGSILELLSQVKYCYPLKLIIIQTFLTCGFLASDSAANEYNHGYRALWRPDAADDTTYAYGSLNAASSAAPY